MHIMEKKSPRSRSSSPGFSPLAFDQDLAPLPEYRAASTSSVDLGGLLPTPITLHEDLKTGCGGMIWDAGVVLAKHMVRYQLDALRDARILELGAGGGLVGLAVAAARTQRTQPLYLTDLPEMLQLMQLNVRLNQLEQCVKPLVLSWGETLTQEVVDFRPNVILAADCVYFELAFPLLLQTLQKLFTLCPDAIAFFCFRKRRKADMQFLKKARKIFQVEEPEDMDRKEYSRSSIFLYTFRRKILIS